MTEHARSGPEQEASNELVLSFLAVRQAIGWIGVALPFALIASGVVLRSGIEPSISEFYFTSAADLFVGALCAIGVFLAAYTGFEPRPEERISDFWVAKIAAVAVFGVALIPTSGPDVAPPPFAHRFVAEGVASALHYGSAAVFFACLAIFCLVLFRRSDPAKPIDDAKRVQNKIYFACGVVIVATMLLMVAWGLLVRFTDAAIVDALAEVDAVFWLESIGVWAFGVSWLTKGKLMRPLEGVVRKMS